MSDRDRRRLARRAISELFLDTQLDDGDFSRLRDMLVESRLSVHELDYIYYDELAPILYRNVNTPSGVWSGFDQDSLEERIGARIGHRPLPLFGSLWRHRVTRTTLADWRRLRQLLLEAQT